MDTVITVKNWSETISAQLLHCFNNEKCCDLSIKFKSGEIIKIHRFILESFCCVESLGEESKEDASVLLAFSHIHHQWFSCIAKFLYSGQVIICPEVLNIAQQLKVTCLLAIAEQQSGPSVQLASEEEHISNLNLDSLDEDDAASTSEECVAPVPANISLQMWPPSALECSENLLGKFGSKTETTPENEKNKILKNGNTLVLASDSENMNTFLACNNYEYDRNPSHAAYDDKQTSIYDHTVEFGMKITECSVLNSVDIHSEESKYIDVNMLHGINNLPSQVSTLADKRVQQMSDSNRKTLTKNLSEQLEDTISVVSSEVGCSDALTVRSTSLAPIIPCSLYESPAMSVCTTKMKQSLSNSPTRDTTRGLIYSQSKIGVASTPVILCSDTYRNSVGFNIASSANIAELPSEKIVSSYVKPGHVYGATDENIHVSNVQSVPLHNKTTDYINASPSSVSVSSHMIINVTCSRNVQQAGISQGRLASKSSTVEDAFDALLSSRSSVCTITADKSTAHAGATPAGTSLPPAPVCAPDNILLVPTNSQVLARANAAHRRRLTTNVDEARPTRFLLDDEGAGNASDSGDECWQRVATPLPFPAVNDSAVTASPATAGSASLDYSDTLSQTGVVSAESEMADETALFGCEVFSLSSVNRPQCDTGSPHRQTTNQNTSTTVDCCTDACSFPQLLLRSKTSQNACPPVDGRNAVNKRSSELESECPPHKRGRAVPSSPGCCEALECGANETHYAHVSNQTELGTNCDTETFTGTVETFDDSVTTRGSAGKNKMPRDFTSINLPVANDAMPCNTSVHKIVEQIDSSSSVHHRTDSTNSLSVVIPESCNGKIRSVRTLGRSNVSGKELFDHAKIISEVLNRYPNLVKNKKNLKFKIMKKFGTQTESDINSVQYTLTGNKLISSSTSSLTVLPRNRPSFLPTTATSGLQAYFKCSQCAMSCPTYDLLKQHVHNHHKVDANAVMAAMECRLHRCFSCLDKPRYFADAASLSKHGREVHNKIEQKCCRICGYKPLRKLELCYHLYKEHKIEPPRSVSFPKCDLCEFIALTKNDLLRHRSNRHGSDSYACSSCHGNFRSFGALQGHLQAKACQMKPGITHNCPHCPQTFSKSYNLKVHIRSRHKSKIVKPQSNSSPVAESATVPVDVLSSQATQAPQGDGVPAFVMLLSNRETAGETISVSTTDHVSVHPHAPYEGILSSNIDKEIRIVKSDVSVDNLLYEEVVSTPINNASYEEIIDNTENYGSTSICRRTVLTGLDSTRVCGNSSSTVTDVDTANSIDFDSNILKSIVQLSSKSTSSDVYDLNNRDNVGGVYPVTLVPGELCGSLLPGQLLEVLPTAASIHGVTSPPFVYLTYQQPTNSASQSLACQAPLNIASLTAPMAPHDLQPLQCNVSSSPNNLTTISVTDKQVHDKLISFEVVSQAPYCQPLPSVPITGLATSHNITSAVYIPDTTAKTSSSSSQCWDDNELRAASLGHGDLVTGTDATNTNEVV